MHRRRRRLAALEARIQELEQQARRAGDPLDHPHVHATGHVRVAPGVVLRAGEDNPITFEDGVQVYRDAELTGPVHLEPGVFLNRGAYVQGQVRIGHSTAVGQHVRILTDTHEIGVPERRAGAKRVLPVDIGAGAWLGASVTVLPGVSVGDGAVVAAGAVVTRDVPPHTVVGGVPAAVIRTLAGPTG